MASSIIINDLIVNANLTVIHTLFSVAEPDLVFLHQVNTSDTEKKTPPCIQITVLVVHPIVQYVQYLKQYVSIVLIW